MTLVMPDLCIPWIKTEDCTIGIDELSVPSKIKKCAALIDERLLVFRIDCQSMVECINRFFVPF